MQMTASPDLSCKRAGGPSGFFCGKLCNTGALHVKHMRNFIPGGYPEKLTGSCVLPAAKKKKSFFFRQISGIIRFVLWTNIYS